MDPLVALILDRILANLPERERDGVKRDVEQLLQAHEQQGAVTANEKASDEHQALRAARDWLKGAGNPARKAHT